MTVRHGQITAFESGRGEEDGGGGGGGGGGLPSSSPSPSSSPVPVPVPVLGPGSLVSAYLHEVADWRPRVGDERVGRWLNELLGNQPGGRLTN